MYNNRLNVWLPVKEPAASAQHHYSSSAFTAGSHVSYVLVQGVQDVLGGLGLGAIAGQLADLQLGELLDTPPPGLDEAVAIAKVHTTPCA